jgi:hypothetical protein
VVLASNGAPTGSTILRAMRGLVLVVAIAAVAPAAAAPQRPSVAAIALPTRRSDAPKLAALAERTAARVRDRLGGTTGSIRPASADLPARLARAHGLLLDAKLDEAAATYDLALAAADQAPGTLDAAVLVGAHVARAQIALARGEAERADALFGRVMRWDGDFAATGDEATPAVQERLAHLRETVPASAIEPADLGDACRQVDTLVVVRAAPMGAIEIARFDGCRRVAALVVQGPPGDALVLDRLAPAPIEHRVTTTPALYRRPWFWIAVSAVAVSGVSVWAWTEMRDEGGYDVAIHF